MHSAASNTNTKRRDTSQRKAWSKSQAARHKCNARPLSEESQRLGLRRHEKRWPQHQGKERRETNTHRRSYTPRPHLRRPGASNQPCDAAKRWRLPEYALLNDRASLSRRHPRRRPERPASWASWESWESSASSGPPWGLQPSTPLAWQQSPYAV